MTDMLERPFRSVEHSPSNSDPHLEEIETGIPAKWDQKTDVDRTKTVRKVGGMLMELAAFEPLLEWGPAHLSEPVEPMDAQKVSTDK